MTGRTTGRGRRAARGSGRYHLNRAGILNVWQYDEQVFDLADGRLLLRGANGAGKSKTLEMLLPFALDGDKMRITASSRHHTSLLWLMTDGHDADVRTGYVWVEFVHVGGDGQQRVFTCGVGLRASAAQRAAGAWFFTTSRRVGHDLELQDATGPLSRDRLADALGDHGRVFDRAADYKQHVGRSLFGLGPAAYDEVLRLLYWLRQPQVGEDIQPSRLAEQLSQALPQLDVAAVRSAGDTFDELAAFGEQIERRARAAVALGSLADTYAEYARAVAADRARDLLAAVHEERRLRSAVERAAELVEGTRDQLATAQQQLDAAETGVRDSEARLRGLESSPEARGQQRLSGLEDVLAGEQELARREAAYAQQTETEHERRHAALRRDAQRIVELLHEHAAVIRDLDVRQRASAPGSGIPLPAGLEAAALVDVSVADAARQALEASAALLADARAAVGRRGALVRLAVDAVHAVDRAETARRIDEERASEAERRWASARDRRHGAQRTADTAAQQTLIETAAWAGRQPSVRLALPPELSPGGLDALAAQVRTACSTRADELRAELARQSGRQAAAADRVGELTGERHRIEAGEPTPPGPAGGRTERAGGAALWSVVDFEPHLDEPSRAGLEAALEATGLLDAWVRPGGMLLSGRHRDVVLRADRPATAPTLADALRVDLRANGDLDVGGVRALLAAVHLGRRADAQVRVDIGGSWRLGPLHGRAEKPAAQYVGAAARTAERHRRLAELDVRLGEATRSRDGSAAAADRVSAEIGQLESWERTRPAETYLRTAWAAALPRLEDERREQRAHREAAEVARRSAEAAVLAREERDRVAGEHALPIDLVGLDAVTQRLRDLADDLGQAARQAPNLRRDLERWVTALGDTEAASETAAHTRRDAEQTRQQAQLREQELASLHEAVGSEVEALRERIAAVRAARRMHLRAAAEARVDGDALAEAWGAAKATLLAAGDRLTEQLSRRTDRLHAWSGLAAAPGLLESAGVRSRAAFDRAAVTHERDAVPTELVDVAQALVDAAEADARDADSLQDDVRGATHRLWRAHQEVAAGPAADLGVEVTEHGDLLAVLGSDDSGQAPLVTLAARVAGSVERDRGLLTEQERAQFEAHVLGELGDAIRRCRSDAGELVAAMNALLADVTTTQGIRMRLDWRLRDDVPPEARAAVELLERPVEQLGLVERAELREVLHALIEASRQERTDRSYAEHLAAALDYRTWHAFTIRYARPERPEVWERLHARSPLSQGEQKVLCYLPLFAAAAAHFTSLAGAAPYAPRLVLLDDAFPKIDVRTHPLLFGLLVQLDLDFVVTSERLWGDHDTVPSLAVYEAVRDPGERGIVQYEYRWDGRALVSSE